MNIFEFTPLDNDAPLLYRGVTFRIIQARVNTPLEFLTGFTLIIWRGNGTVKLRSRLLAG